jgi:hypothetical protein
MRQQRERPIRATVADGRRVEFSLGGLGLALSALPTLSSLLQLYDSIQYWGKLVHALEAFGVTLMFGVLLLAWRDREAVDISDQLSALLSMFVGILFGVVWALFEFLMDWTLGSALQKSNGDTMTNLLWNDVTAVVAAVAAGHLYCHLISPADRRSLGRLSAWLVDGPSQMLDRNGMLVALVFALLGSVAVASLWVADRFTLLSSS